VLLVIKQHSHLVLLLAPSLPAVQQQQLLLLLLLLVFLQ
jgi:hypothetical protein